MSSGSSDNLSSSDCLSVEDQNTQEHPYQLLRNATTDRPDSTIATTLAPEEENILTEFFQYIILGGDEDTAPTAQAVSTTQPKQPPLSLQHKQSSTTTPLPHHHPNATHDLVEEGTRPPSYGSLDRYPSPASSPTIRPSDSSPSLCTSHTCCPHHQSNHAQHIRPRFHDEESQESHAESSGTFVVVLMVAVLVVGMVLVLVGITSRCDGPFC